MWRAPLFLPLLLLLFSPSAAGDEGPVRRVGTMRHGPLDEVSGIVASRTYPGVYWVHRQLAGYEFDPNPAQATVS